ncbi:MAG: hypothetical protein WCW36_03445 [Candidatus Paceibacterota bacterium]|jgi:hypothetical protein
MSWASNRQFIILAIIGLMIFAFFAVVTIATLYKAPSCSDGVQNHGEAGIDCGGPCQYLCTNEAHAPTVIFTKVITNDTGRIDVVASIENVNATAAAKSVPYMVTLYGADRALIQQVTGTIDLPPASTIPVFIQNVNQNVVHAFLTIDRSVPSWYMVASDPRILPVVSNTTIRGTTDAPRIDAIVSNSSAIALSDVRMIIIVHDASGEVITASQTIVQEIPAQGQATATFTWNRAFPGTPAAIEVIPVVPLP